MKWISVKDRLPDKSQEVFVSDGDVYGQSCTCAWYNTSKKSFYPSTDALDVDYYGGGVIRLDIEVKYWMPIPEPPE